MKVNIICDLDGTIALDTHRNYLLQCSPRKWDEYFALCGGDDLNEPIFRILHSMWMHHPIHIITGRRADTREETEKWLRKNRVPYDSLTMREKDNREDDHILKIEMARELKLEPENVIFVLEDRQRVVDAWRAARYTCLQVAPGKF